MINIFATDIEIMKQEAIQSYPRECCGLLLGKIYNFQKQIVKIVPTENDWENQKDLFAQLDDKLTRQCEDSFSINPLTILQIQKQARQDNLDIMGIYHSHPNHDAIPSAFDTKFAWSMYSYIIMSVKEGSVENVRSWILNESRQFVEEDLQIEV